MIGGVNTEQGVKVQPPLLVGMIPMITSKEGLPKEVITIEELFL